MMSQWVSFGLSLVLLGLTPANSAVAAGKEPVRLYTNADLDRLGGEQDETMKNVAPLPQQAVFASDGAGDWELVLRMLDRERERVEAERQERLERERIDLAREIAAESSCQRRYFPAGVALFPAFPGTFPFPPDTPHVRTGREIDLARVRVPLAQRGVRSAGDLYRESLSGARQRHLTNPPSQRRPGTP